MHKLAGLLQRWPKRLLIAAGVVVVLSVIAIPAMATHTSTVTITSPSSFAPNTTYSSITLHVVNTGTADKINTVELVVDSNWTSVGATAPANWTATVNGNTITWSTTNKGVMILKNNGSKDFTWSATTGPAGTYRHDWTTTDNAGGTFSSIAPGTGTPIVGVIADAPNFYLGPALAVGVAGLIFLAWRWKLKRRKMHGQA